MIIVLSVVITVLVMVIIFLGIRCYQYHKAWVSTVKILNEIVSSDNSINDAISVLSMVFNVDEGVLRRTLDELQASCSKR